MPTHGTLCPAPAPTGLVAHLASRILGILVVVDGWFARRRQRRDLAELDDHLLKDLGLTRADVEREVGKPFWRP